MAARNPFASSLPDIYDVYAPQVSRRPQLSTGYHFIRYLLYVGAIVGGVVALYRNDVLLELARRAGQESRYLEVEKSFVGSPGWGTPRSMEPVLKGEASETAPAGIATSTSDTPPSVSTAAAVAAAPVEPSTPSPVEAKAPTSPVAAPSEPARAAAPAAEASRPEAAPAHPAAAAVATGAPAHAAVDPLAPVSLDSLPVLNKAGAAPRTTTASAPRAAEPAPVSHAVAAAPAPHPATAPNGAKAAKFSLEEAAPASRHASHASAPPPEPAPKPAAKPAPPSGPKTTDAHPNDNPLMAAVRGAVRSHPAKSSVPAAR